jgi:hypothetical protein
MARFLGDFILTNFYGLTNFSGSILKNPAVSIFKIFLLLLCAC